MSLQTINYKSINPYLLRFIGTIFKSFCFGQHLRLYRNTTHAHDHLSRKVLLVWRIHSIHSFIHSLIFFIYSYWFIVRYCLNLQIVLLETILRNREQHTRWFVKDIHSVKISRYFFDTTCPQGFPLHKTATLIRLTELIFGGIKDSSITKNLFIDSFPTDTSVRHCHVALKLIALSHFDETPKRMENWFLQCRKVSGTTATRKERK